MKISWQIACCRAGESNNSSAGLPAPFGWVVFGLEQCHWKVNIHLEFV